MAQRLTDESVAKIAPPANKRTYLIVYDGGHRAAVPGFGVRVTRTGARSFVMHYRVRGAGTERLYTIGPVSSGTASGWKTGAARKRAAELRRVIDSGGDPMADLHRERSAPTMRELATRYLDEYATRKKRPRSVAEDKSIIQQIILPAIGHRRVGDVSKDDLSKLHRKIATKGFPARRIATKAELAQGDLFARPRPQRPTLKDRLREREPRPAPVRANRTLTLLGKMFNLAIEWKMRTDNPAARFERSHEERKARYLNLKELARLSVELRRRSNVPSANAVRLLLLTGARRGEVLSAAWHHFDLEAGVWTKPSAHTKQKKEHRVPLSPPALELLVSMKKGAAAKAKKEKRPISPLLFPSARGRGAQAQVKRFWATTREKAGLPSSVRLHDLRHTYASILASAGQSLPVIGQLLGHTQPGTTARYANLFDDPLRRATDHVAGVIAANDQGRSAEIHTLGASTAKQ